MTKSYIIDMDGVIVRGDEMIPGADKFIERLHQRGVKFLILTNTSLYTPADLAHRLQRSGINVTADHIYTSALATAAFLKWQEPNATVFVLGESGLTEALHQVGYVLTDRQPDYVVLGETSSYNYQHITQAIRLVKEGARFIGTNPDALVARAWRRRAIVRRARRACRNGRGRASVLHRQAESGDDAHRVTLAQRTFRERDYGR